MEKPNLKSTTKKVVAYIEFLEQQNKELEGLCDATYVAKGADAYEHACETLEEEQRKRLADNRKVQGLGTLCGSITWLFAELEKAEDRKIEYKNRAALLEALLLEFVTSVNNKSPELKKIPLAKYHTTKQLLQIINKTLKKAFKNGNPQIPKRR